MGTAPGVAQSFVEPARPATLALDQRLPVLAPLETLLPDRRGLSRGSVVAVSAAPGVAGATALGLALAAGPSQAGAWVAVLASGKALAERSQQVDESRRATTGGSPVGRHQAPDASLGFVAAAGLGLALDRLVVVVLPGEARGVEAAVVAALVAGFDVVLLGRRARARLGRRDGRRLVARTREKGGVLVGLGGDLPGEAARLHLRVVASSWEGPEEGAGHLRSRWVQVEATGRGAASRPRRAELWLPAADGSLSPVVEQLEPRRAEAEADAG
jgi:hypothetical protein